jgi:hypothetical protein
MSRSGQQWAMLDSQHERLVEGSHPVLGGGVPRRGRKPWHRRAAATAARVEVPAPRHARSRAARPEA